MLESPFQDDLRRVAARLRRNCPHHSVVEHQVLHVPLLQPLGTQRAVPLHQTNVGSGVVEVYTLSYIIHLGGLKPQSGACSSAGSWRHCCCSCLSAMQVEAILRVRCDARAVPPGIGCQRAGIAPAWQSRRRGGRSAAAPAQA